MKNFSSKKITASLLVIIVVLFSLVFLFTRPAIFPFLSLTDTGEIGDTIGGITSPVINLIAAYLVYVSFLAQVKANKKQLEISTKQFETLEKEILESSRDRNYEVVLNLFKDLKEDYFSLKTLDGKLIGEVALKTCIDYYINHTLDIHRPEQVRVYDNIIVRWKYILTEYSLIASTITSVSIREMEKHQLIKLLLSFYEAHLEYASNQLIQVELHSTETVIPEFSIINDLADHRLIALEIQETNNLLKEV